MRALVAMGLCKETGDGSFELTPLGSYLRSDVEGSVHGWLLYSREESRVWAHLLDCVRTGETATKIAYGKEAFEFLAENPELAALFNRAALEGTRQVSGAIISAFDFSEFRTVVDVGGGYGYLLAAMLARYPNLAGVLFDLPHSMEGAKSHLADAGLADRCQFFAGSFSSQCRPAPTSTCSKAFLSTGAISGPRRS
jgi:hypothetical protein